MLTSIIRLLIHPRRSDIEQGMASFPSDKRLCCKSVHGSTRSVLSKPFVPSRASGRTVFPECPERSRRKGSPRTEKATFKTNYLAVRPERVEGGTANCDTVSKKKGTLYIVSTPIGNLEDITLRALRILKEVDLIAAEDTRHTLLLLRHFGIHTPLTSYFEGNEMKKREFILSKLYQGDRIALVSDAGTPGISDPGYRLIRLAIENEIPVIPIPGPSAAITALSVSGLPTDAFLFKGFLPHKSKKRRDILKQLEEVKETLIFYESPHRLFETMRDIFEVLGDREIVLTRELTKMYEEVLRGKVSEIRTQIGEKKLKGEITLVVSGKTRKKQ